jgi:hypothetical protein
VILDAARIVRDLSAEKKPESLYLASSTLIFQTTETKLRLR